MALFTAIEYVFMYLHYIHPLIYHHLPNVWKAFLTIRASIFFMFRIVCPISRISSSLVFTGSLAVILSHWWIDCNRMDWYRVSMVDVPVASGATCPWQQQRCDSLHCHRELWGSVPPRVVKCFTQSLKIFLCTTTSWHFNFDPGTLL